MVQLARLKREYLVVATVLLAFFMSCVSTGAPGLSKEVVDKVVEGQTTKDEIVSLLGNPEQQLRLHKQSLENYIRRVSLERPAEVSFPEDQYEVWTYSRWSHFAAPVFLPGQETATFFIVVIDSNGMCVKKLFAKESKTGL